MKHSAFLVRPLSSCQCGDSFDSRNGSTGSTSIDDRQVKPVHIISTNVWICGDGVRGGVPSSCARVRGRRSTVATSLQWHSVCAPPKALSQSMCAACD